MTNHEAIKDFWDKQADEHKVNPQATAPDVHYRDLEISRILPHLMDNGLILDIGCGNGYSTLKFAEANPNAKFIGADYSRKMIESAIMAQNATPIRNCSFIVHDVLKLTGLRTKYDIIVSERCLINLPTFNDQKSALLEMRRCLNVGGKLILVENTREGLVSLNSLRTKLGLSRIEMRWHNQYLPQQDFLKYARLHFTVQTVDCIGNLYYILSRVVYAKLCEIEKKEIDYNHPINRIAAQLPSLPAYGWSPNYLFVMRAI